MSSIPAGINVRSVLPPYSDVMLIGVMLKGKDGAALKEHAKAVVGTDEYSSSGDAGGARCVWDIDDAIPRSLVLSGVGDFIGGLIVTSVLSFPNTNALYNCLVRIFDFNTSVTLTIFLI
jgi:hypothetical protein